MKIKNLDIYKVNIDYIKELSKYENKIMYEHNSKHTRPYVGIVLNIDEYKYFAPLSSKVNKGNNSTDVKLIEKKNNIVGIIKINNMIPVNLENLEVLKIQEFKEKDREYYDLLQAQLKLINDDIIKNRIENKAIKLYNLKIDKPNSFISNLCNDFKLLEEKYIEYNKLENKQAPKIKMLK